MAETYDYIVAGGGSAGCVVAARLAAAGAEVLLLEAGGTDRRPDVVIPGGVVSAYKFCNWDFLPEPDHTRNGVVEPWPAGKILGGGGSINGTVFVRGNPADFDRWAKAGCIGWDYASVLPYFKRLETWAGGASDYRGGSGPIAVGFHRVPHPASDAFLQAAGQAGYDVVDDYNGAEQEGAGVVQVNQRRGRRSQSSREYLRRGSVRPTVRTGAFVTRILTRGDRAEGVEYRHHRSIAVAHARREVIVSAGTLVSPKLLMVSGIGPEHELRRHGIRTVADTPGVGSNLADHIGVLLRWNARIPTLNEMKAGDALRAVWEYARHGTGTLAATVFQVQVILRTSPDLALPDIQLAFASFAINRRGPDGALKVRLAKTNSVMVTVAMLHPRSTATIRLRSADPAASPVIDQQMLADTDDVADLMAGMTEARRIVAQPAMAGIVSTPFDAEAECATDEDWRRFVRDNATYGVHPVGTCRMGIDDLAVVDPELRVHGVGGLRVVDASVMPTTTSGNTNAPVMMIAERAADLILGTGS